MNVDELVSTLSRAKLTGAHERQVQDAIERALVDAGAPFSREVSLGEAGRIDFEVELPRVPLSAEQLRALTPAGGLTCTPVLPLRPRLGIEIKVQGGLREVTEQMARYAETGRYTSLLLVTTKRLHRMPPTLCGVPIRVCHLWGAIL